MYYRRKILLSLISAFGERGLDRLKLQKLLFLFCSRQENPAFDFVPYKYGCFSFQAAKDLSVLSDHYQYLEKKLEKKQDRWVYRKTEADVSLKPEEKVILDKLLERFFEDDSATVVNYVYDRFPYFLIRSEWNMSGKQRRAAQEERAKIRKRSSANLFTIGYEGRSIDSYLDLLIRENIRLLCDARKNPVSMKYGFSRRQLEKYCKELGIIYCHMPELGIVSDHRKSLRTAQDYKRLFDDYRQRLSRQSASLARVIELLNQHKRIALTCFEREPKYCHRHCISDYLVQKEGIACQNI